MIYFFSPDSWNGCYIYYTEKNNMDWVTPRRLLLFRWVMVTVGGRWRWRRNQNSKVREQEGEREREAEHQGHETMMTSWGAMKSSSLISTTPSNHPQQVCLFDLSFSFYCSKRKKEKTSAGSFGVLRPFFASHKIQLNSNGKGNSWRLVIYLFFLLFFYEGNLAHFSPDLFTWLIFDNLFLEKDDVTPLSIHEEPKLRDKESTAT